MYWDFSRFGDAPALIADTGVTITYRGLASLSEEAEAAAGRHAGGDSGQKPLVMLVCRNSLGALAGYAALAYREYPVLPVSADLSAGMRKELINVYRPGFLLLPEETRHEHPAMKAVWKIRDYVLLKSNFPELYPVNPELGLLITTSGSTGSAKYVRQSRGNLRFNAETIAGCLGIGPSDKTITALPLQYTYGLSILHANLLRGAAMVVTRSGIMDPEFWDLVEAENVTCFHGVPNTYDMLYRIGLFEDVFPSLRTMSQAGGKLSRELQEYYGRYAEKNGKRFVIMYGLSEATAAVSWLPPGDILRKPGSVGVVIPGGNISLEDEAGRPAAGPNARGEVVYRGPNAAMGYAQRGEDLALGDEWNGVIRTGDIAELDGENYLTITGRLKRYIKMAGHRVNLEEVDGMIMDEFNIPSASVGTDDRLTVFVTEEAEKDQVEAFVLGRIGAARTGFRVQTIPEFPRNEGGKILYSRLQEMAEQDWART